jgi:hypothetical protein
MVLDHAGKIFFPDVLILQVIGRLAFPIFAWFIANGYRKTRNVNKYISRLFIFALVSQVPFYLAFSLDPFRLNIFFTLFLGLAAVHLYERIKNKVMGLSVVAVIVILATFFQTDYAFYGIMTIFLFHLYFDDFKKLVVSLSVLTVLYEGLIIAITSELSFQAHMQAFSLLSLFLIPRYNGKMGRKLKFVFYSFYPVHLLVFYFLKNI